MINNFGICYICFVLKCFFYLQLAILEGTVDCSTTLIVAHKMHIFQDVIPSRQGLTQIETVQPLNMYQ